ncbi:hypothetical protein [Streptomyces sp. CB03238]|uniref:hypothetical protein n=1 Tax=Streptomyces sp. CB03238 TaxID=1907777 RepID=UPI000A11BA35|nr:hypothetical protein [Streptomyces sp. CB03238]ORT60533.1 hypothetical protein BKD26_09225 [Streptomyces sp. CB03238]
MTDDGVQHLNAAAARGTQRDAAGAEGLAALKERFAEIASAGTMFGRVPNGAAAAAALEEAARRMLEELERAGVSVQNVVNNAGVVAGIADATDELAELQARLAVPDGPPGAGAGPPADGGGR